MADTTSLWPAILTGLFALGGIYVGQLAMGQRDAAQEAREARKRRSDKFEELVAAVYEFDHWLDRTRDRDAFGIGDNTPQGTSPIAKVQSISSVYFPQFSELVDELGTASIEHLQWIYRAMGKRVTNDVDHLDDGFNEAHQPYAAKFSALLAALTNFARKEFQ